MAKGRNGDFDQHIYNEYNSELARMAEKKMNLTFETKQVIVTTRVHWPHECPTTDGAWKPLAIIFKWKFKKDTRNT